MQRLGQPQIPLAFESARAREQDSHAAHEEAGPMRPPCARVNIARSAKIEKVFLILPAECAWHMLAVLDGRRYRNQRVVRGSSQRCQRL